MFVSDSAKRDSLLLEALTLDQPQQVAQEGRQKAGLDSSGLIHIPGNRASSASSWLWGAMEIGAPHCE